jgi:putative transposase
VESKYHTGAHCKYLLKVHLIFVVSYRLKIINKYADFFKKEFSDIAEKYKFDIIMMEVDQDHIHLLVDYPPSMSISYLVQILKSISTRSLWKNHAESVNKHIWGHGSFWSEGYFACSTGDVSTEIIRQYIENQG